MLFALCIFTSRWPQMAKNRSPEPNSSLSNDRIQFWQNLLVTFQTPTCWSTFIKTDVFTASPITNQHFDLFSCSHQQLALIFLRQNNERIQSITQLGLIPFTWFILWTKHILGMGFQLINIQPHRDTLIIGD